MSEMNKKKKKKKPAQVSEAVLKRRRRSVLILMAEVAFCLLLSITCFGVSLLNSYAYADLDESVYKADFSQVQKVTQVIEETNESGEVVETKIVEVEVPVDEVRKGYRNILVVGLDARSQENMDGGNGLNSDVMMIVSINEETGEIKLVSILRDTILKMEEGSGTKAYNKANNQFAASGISDTVSMVNRNLDLDIDEYIIVNWYAVAQCVNQLGGIELTLDSPQMVTWFNSYLDFTNRATGMWAPEIREPGTYLMVGTQVVAFCRIRYGGLNDTGRTQNQRIVIEKMMNRAIELIKNGDYNAVLNCAESGLQNVQTNLRTPDILSMAAGADRFHMGGNAQFPKDFTTASELGNYTAKYGVRDPLVANNFEQEVIDLHTFLFPDLAYAPSDFVRTISYQMMLDRTGQ